MHCIGSVNTPVPLLNCPLTYAILYTVCFVDVRRGQVITRPPSDDYRQ